ncbi:hypothetical protein L596_007782 [Steinernema carpocapsae]|uniref:Uncharacterized protein n=1 Tax=Steinernema carpocapsae TaxID=34508 RepID=A0A4U5PAF0_STECR|nr:hypothetical protein L596_007782 [Steinernema carpocapsae]
MSDANINQDNPTVRNWCHKSTHEQSSMKRRKQIQNGSSAAEKTPQQTTQSNSKEKDDVNSTLGNSNSPGARHKLSRKFKDRRPSGKGSNEESHMRNSIRQSLKSFKERQAKNLQQVKTFISRPYKTASMQRILSKVTRRKEYREKHECSDVSEDSSSSAQRLKDGDDIFPILKKQKSPSKESPSPNSPPPPKESPKATGPQRTLADDIKEKLFKPKRHVRLVKNNDNNGQLFMADGMPFWHQKGKGIKGRQDVDSKADLTDDELPMNADMLLDVHSGKVTLIEMPNNPITLDPYASLEVLEARDEQFFTRNVLFSNTIRSMINLNDEMTTSDRKKPSSVPTQTG